MNLQIYTDGACSGNPLGKGAWAVVFVIEGKVAFIKTGILDETTANKAELMAAYQAIDHISNEPNFYDSISIYCDSAYVVNCVNKNYLNKWVKNDWKNVDGIPIKHSELWEPLHQAIKTHKIKFYKIRGHSGDVLNSMADQLAKLELRKVMDPVYHSSRIKQVKTINANI